jgi:hypothetical protein
MLASSERYKTHIAPMGSASDKLDRLRPVTFNLKTDPNGTVQYGLIAEEVAAIYPDLVIRDNQGVIQGVRYDELAPLLLNEIQRQRLEALQRQVRINDLERQLLDLKGSVAKFQECEESPAIH